MTKEKTGVSGIEITIDKKKLVLSVDEARELHKALSELFNIKMIGSIGSQVRHEAVIPLVPPVLRGVPFDKTPKEFTYTDSPFITTSPICKTTNIAEEKKTSE